MFSQIACARARERKLIYITIERLRACCVTESKVENILYTYISHCVNQSLKALQTAKLESAQHTGILYGRNIIH